VRQGTIGTEVVQCQEGKYINPKRDGGQYLLSLFFIYQFFIKMIAHKKVKGVTFKTFSPYVITSFKRKKI
jgi:hypothetical protein